MVLAKRKSASGARIRRVTKEQLTMARHELTKGTCTVITRNAWLVCLTFTLSTLAQAGGPSPIQRFALTSQDPGPDVYLYAGTEAFDVGEANVVGAPLELRVFLNDTFEVGNVFTCEPGLYDEPLLHAGMRLENDYVVTATGIENLSPFPMEL